MSNEIEIVISDRDTTGPGAQSAERRMRRLGDDTERALETAGKKAGAKLGKGIQDEAPKGAKEGSRAIVASLGSIDDQIEKTKKEVVALGKSFTETGQQDVFEKLRDARGVLANLQKIKKESETLGEESGRSLTDGVDRETKRGFPRVLSGLRMATTPVAIGVGVSLGVAVAQGMGQALSAGGAIGVAGLGALILSQRKDVRMAGAQLAEDLKQELMRDAEPLVEPLLDGFKKIKNTIVGLGPQIKGLFSDAEPAIDAVVDGLTGFVRGVLPGFREFVQESGPGLEAVSQGMAQLGRDTGTALRVLSGGSKDSGKALQDLIGFIGDTEIALAGLIRAAETAGKYSAGGLNLIMGATKKLTDHFTKDLQPSTSAVADQQKVFGRTLAHSAKEMRGLTDAAMEYNEAALAMADSDIAFQQAIDDATQAIKDNGKTLDINTQKGRDNKSALLQIAGAAISSAQAVKEMGGSQESATRKLNDGYTAFVKAAHGAGMSETAARRLAISYGLLPRVKKTEVSAPGAKGAKNAVDSLSRSIRNLHGKDVFITTHFVTRGDRGSQWGNQVKASGGLVGSGISSAQEGGARGNRVLVGEHMPEIVELPSGSRVNSGPDSQRMLAETKNVLPELLIQFKSGGSRLEDLLMEILRNHIDVRWGGDVTKALSRRPR